MKSEPSIRAIAGAPEADAKVPSLARRIQSRTGPDRLESITRAVSALWTRAMNTRAEPSNTGRVPARGPAATLLRRAPVAQLDRASVYGTEGQRFESSRARSRS